MGRREEEGQRRRRERERKGMRMTQYVHSNKWFFNTRHSIHLLKYCLIG